MTTPVTPCNAETDTRLQRLIEENARLYRRIYDLERRLQSDRDKKVNLAMHRDELEEQVEERDEALSTTIEALRVEIQERQRAERQLRQSEADLRHITQQTMDTLEADRQLVAKEIHDSIAGSLAAIKFALEAVVPRDDRTGGGFGQIIGHLKDTIKETKRIAANLRPTMLDDLGLLSTMQWFFREFGALYQQTEIRQHVTVAEEDIPETLKIVIYRILQEALNNAAKHGSPDIIRVNLNKSEEHIILNVEDNGCGFDVGDTRINEDPMRGHGLMGMRQRAEICGGVFVVASEPGGGTRIHVALPRGKFDSEG